MNILIDGVPEAVRINGREYPINSDFRTSMAYELLMQNEEVPGAEKVERALDLYYPKAPNDVAEAVNAIVWFYSCGGRQTGSQHEEPGESDGSEAYEESPAASGMVYSFDYDAPYIFAAFFEQYGIDLTETNLHWWKFKAMFQSLSDRTRIMKIIGFRSIEITDKMSKEQKRYYSRMKKMYELPRSQKEIEKQLALIEALRQGKDVSALL